MFAHYSIVKASQLLCGIYGIIAVLYPGRIGSLAGARDPNTGFIIDHNDPSNTQNGLLCSDHVCRAVIASDTIQLILLGLARFAAYTMYPCLVLVITTKLRATGAFLSKTPYSMFMYQDVHGLHVYCGWTIFINSCLHVLFHVARFILQNNSHLLFDHITGVTGLIAVLSILLISIPMMFKYCRDRIKYEFRKNVHYLFVFFLIIMSMHAPRSAVPNAGFCAYIFPVLLIWYSLDFIYCSLFMTELIETTKFHTLPSGVQISMVVSKRFESWAESGGYGYICLPWVDRTQWHAFSLFEHPDDPSTRQTFMQNNGDWTQNVLHRLMQRNTQRPIWIQGPFPSPYNNAIQYDNEILVAAGIGITPALAVIRSQKENRRINLIWAVRDPEMLHFFLEHAYLSHSGWNLIFYTGKRPLVGLDEWESTNICIIKSRPDVDIVIPNIIYGIETGDGLPEKYSDKTEAIGLLRQKLDELDEEEDGLTPKQKICELARYAKDDLGFVFYDLMHHLDMIDEDLNIMSSATSCNSFDSLDAMESVNTDIEAGVTQTPEQPYIAANDPLSGQIKVSAAAERGLKFRNQRSLAKANEKVLRKLRKYKLSPDDKVMDRRGLFGTSDSARSFEGLRRRSSGNQWSNPIHRRSSFPPRGFMYPSVQQLNNRMGQSTLKEQWVGLVDDMDMAFKPWVKNDKALPYVKGLDKKMVLSTWGVMYCGGKNKLLEKVKKVTKEIGLHIHEESFDW